MNAKLSSRNNYVANYNPNEDTFISEDNFVIEGKHLNAGVEGLATRTKTCGLKTPQTSGNGSSASNPEDVTSDSSTICAESVSFDQMNQRYNQKVKELIQEHSQNLNDLNVLRRIFMVLFKKCCLLFSIKISGDELNSEEDNSNGDQIEQIFGNFSTFFVHFWVLIKFSQNLLTEIYLLSPNKIRGVN